MPNFMAPNRDRISKPEPVKSRAADQQEENRRHNEKKSLTCHYLPPAGKLPDWIDYATRKNDAAERDTVAPPSRSPLATPPNCIPPYALTKVSGLLLRDPQFEFFPRSAPGSACQ